MKSKITPVLGVAGIMAAATIFFQVSCGSGQTTPVEASPEKKEMTKEEMIARGQYLTSFSGCHDCHTPKVFGPHGMSLDSTRLLSGHPANDRIPPVDPKALQPGHWIMFSPGLTAVAGPWGISYSANLTADSATGIGAWDEHTFVSAIRTGKHMGMENGRPIMPPMPWEYIAKMTDEDLRSIYAFLRTLKPVSNRVPGPVPPDEVAKMAK